MDKLELVKVILSDGFTSKGNEEIKAPFNVGEQVFIRCVTYHNVGEVESCNNFFVTLKKASWVADSGRFSNALETGQLSEVERVKDGTIRIALASIVDVFEWKHPLPVETKPAK